MFRHLLTFDKRNLSEKVGDLYDLMECPRDISKITNSRINNRNPAEYEENENLKPLVKELQGEPLWKKLFGVGALFRSIGYLNATPYHFEETIAPFFFKSFPHGKIWFVERDEEKIGQIFRRENELSEKIFGSKAVLMGKRPQNMSGLQIYDTLQDFGLSLALILNFPKIYGANVHTLWGSFLFIPQLPLNIYQEYRLNITDALHGNLDLLYSDDATVSSGPRRQINYFEENILHKYLEWYVDHLGILIDFVFKRPSLEDFYLLSLTLSRICVETYSIQLSSSSFVRKITFFNLLDKYASLVKEVLQLGIRDVEIWKRMLSTSTYRNRIEHSLQKVDLNVGSTFKEIGSALYGDNATTLSLNLSSDLTEKEVTSLLRAYRNSHHGYFLGPNDRKLLLSHTGNISNALPDLSIIFWHALLQNPKGFISSLS